MNSKAILLRLFIMVLALIIACATSACAKEQATGKESTEKLTTFFNQQWLKAVVSIEKTVLVNGKMEYRSIGTGFLVNSSKNHTVLVTAKHVVTDKQGNPKESLLYRLNHKAGKSTAIPEELCVQKGFGEWFISGESDVALRFVGKFSFSDILTIPANLFMKSDLFQSGTPALILGFPMGLRSEDYAKPIARKAMVARVDDNKVILDGFTFPGNSGGPVVYMPSMMLGGMINIPGYIKDQRLIGLVSSYIPYVDVAISPQTERVRITFEENSGLTNVIPSDEILKVMELKEFRELDEKL